MKTHKDLDVWNVSMDFAEDIYKLTTLYPEEEKYSLTSQLRRSAVSVVSNIAEGAGRQSRRDFIKFLYISLASLVESETQLILSKRLGYVDSDLPVLENIEKIRAMLLGLIKFLKRK